MQIVLETAIAIVATLLAVLGLLYALWPLIETIQRLYRQHRQVKPDHQYRTPNNRDRIPIKLSMFFAWMHSSQIMSILRAWPIPPQDYNPTQSLSNYEQLVKLMNDDPQVVDILLKKLAYQVPNQSQDWYCNVILKQIQRWIVNKISDEANNPTFGEQQVAQYLAKYRHRPNWWIYRKLARDNGLYNPASFGDI